jgi:hypothetical protein
MLMASGCYFIIAFSLPASYKSNIVSNEMGLILSALPDAPNES